MRVTLGLNMYLKVAMLCYREIYAAALVNSQGSLLRSIQVPNQIEIHKRITRADKSVATFQERAIKSIC